MKRVRECGGNAYKFTSPGRAGVPDRCCLFPRGVVWWVETKRPEEDARTRQLREHSVMRGLGQRVALLDSIAAIDTWISVNALDS